MNLKIMKKNILTSIGLTAFFTFAIISFTVVSESGTTSVYAYPEGSPGGRTNSPGDGSSCKACHSGIIDSGSATRSITSTILTSGYVPGQTYTITGTITQSLINAFGFEITSERDADNSKVGTMIITDKTNTQTVGGSAVTHQSAGIAGSGSKSWSFNWTAPAAGTGDVTFYGAFVAANSSSTQFGDQVYTSELKVIEDINTGLKTLSNEIEFNVFPNPVIASVKILSEEAIDELELYNANGVKVIHQKNSNFIDMENLASGIYFIRVIANDKSSFKKIIKK